MSLGFCTKTKSIWKLVGKVFFIFKIVIPLLIILFGMIDLGKAVVAAKDDEIKKSVKSLAMRAVAGVVIFFIPTLVGFIFGIVDEFDEVTSDYDICAKCVSSWNC